MGEIRIRPKVLQIGLIRISHQNPVKLICFRTFLIFWLNFFLASWDNLLSILSKLGGFLVYNARHDQHTEYSIFGDRGDVRGAQDRAVHEEPRLQEDRHRRPGG